MRRNVALTYVLRIARSFALFVPIIVPFYQANGLTQTQIYLLQSFFALTIVLLEVPSGYFADCVGRKQSLVLGSILATAGFALYSISHGFGQLLAAEIVLGVGFSFISGADTALVFDSLAVGGEAGDRYLRFESRSGGFTGMSEGIASILGGGLAVLSLRVPLVAQALVYALTIPLALMLTEPPRVKSSTHHPWKNILRITAYTLHGHREIKWLILYGATMATLTHTMVWLTQPYYQAVGVPLAWFGVLWAGQLFAMSLFARYAHRYENWLGRRRALISFPIIGCVSYLALGWSFSPAMLPILLGFYFVRGVHMPILSHYLNAVVESDIRATVLSVKNLVQKLTYALLGPVIGVVYDAWSLQAALFFSAGLYGVGGLIVLVQMKRLGVL